MSVQGVRVSKHAKSRKGNGAFGKPQAYDSAAVTEREKQSKRLARGASVRKRMQTAARRRR